MSTDPTSLQVDRVSKVFGGIAALDDVSFIVQQGEILGLIGPNGIRQVNRDQHHLEAAPALEGERSISKAAPISHLPPYEVARAGIARTFQLLRLFQGLSVYDNVLTATDLAGSHELLGAVAGDILTRQERKTSSRMCPRSAGFRRPYSPIISAGTTIDGRGRTIA